MSEVWIANASPVIALLDDAAARARARTLGVPVPGTLGVVLRAKRRAVVPSAADVLKELRAAGLRLHDDVIRPALKRFGEVWD